MQVSSQKPFIKIISKLQQNKMALIIFRTLTMKMLKLFFLRIYLFPSIIVNGQTYHNHFFALWNI